MSSHAIGSTHAPSTPFVRPFVARGALWIENHPRGAILALCVLAAGYGLVLGFVPMPQDTLISLATVGGAAFLVSAYVLKRLITMSPLEHARCHLGLKNLNGDEEVYFKKDQNIHVAIINILTNPKTVALRMDDAGKERFCKPRVGENLYAALLNPTINPSLDYLQEEELQALVQTVKENAARSSQEMIEFALGMKLPPSGKLKITIQNTVYELTFSFIENRWMVSMHDYLCTLWRSYDPIRFDGALRKHFLISATGINLPLINCLRAARMEAN